MLSDDEIHKFTEMVEQMYAENVQTGSEDIDDLWIIHPQSNPHYQ